MNDLFLSCGMQYILDRTEPVTPFGRELVRNLTVYTSAEELRFERERLSALLSCRDLPAATNKLDAWLYHLKDLRGSIRACKDGGTLSVIELFELKLLLLSLQGLKQAYETLCSVPGVEFPAPDGALAVLDPFGRQRQTFLIDDAATPELQKIRRQKAETEAALFSCTDSEKQAEYRLTRNRICEAERQEELQIRRHLSEAIAPFCDELLHACESAGRLDWLLRKASMVTRFGAVLPQQNDTCIRMEEMTHPEYAALAAEKGRAFVPITVTLVKGTTLITGANMGGKTVALRTLMLNLILSMTGCPVFAKHAELPMLQSLQLLSGDAENEEEGLSAFGGEMERLRTALEAFGTMGVLVLDEPARGTNPEEAAILVQSLAEYLNGKDGFAVIATHYSGVLLYASAAYRAGELPAEARNALKQLPPDTTLTAAAISERMQYGLTPADTADKDTGAALTIGRLLGLPSELMDLADEKFDAARKNTKTVFSKS